jgi:hypothetical protein
MATPLKGKATEVVPIDPVSVRGKRYAKLYRDWRLVVDSFPTSIRFTDPAADVRSKLSADGEWGLGPVISSLSNLLKRNYALATDCWIKGDRDRAAALFRRAVSAGFLCVEVQRHFWDSKRIGIEEWHAGTGGDDALCVMLIALSGRAVRVASWAAAYVAAILHAGGSVVFTHPSYNRKEDEALMLWLAESVLAKRYLDLPATIGPELGKFLRAVMSGKLPQAVLERFCDVRLSQALKYKTPESPRPAGASGDQHFWAEECPGCIIPIDMLALRGFSKAFAEQEIALDTDHPFLAPFRGPFPNLKPAGENLPRWGSAAVLKEIELDDDVSPVLEAAPTWFPGTWKLGVPL